MTTTARMKHPLLVGQVFYCPRFKDDATHPVVLVDGNYVLNKTRLHLDSRFINTTRTEHMDGGWKRDVATQIDCRPDDWETLGAEHFSVINTAMTGGSTGRDPYPDGHEVVAIDVAGRRVKFYQSGCFINMVYPGDVVLVSGPPDGDEPAW